MRSSTWRLEDLRNVILNLGFVGENLHTRQIFDCKKMFDQYPNASVSMTVTPPEGEPYPGLIERNGDLVSWTVTDSDLIEEGCGEIQLTFMVGEVVAKTCIGRTKVERSLGATGDIPTPIENWIEQAEEVISEAEAATAAAEGAAEHQPIIDDNGYWAVWDADAEEYVATEYKAQGTDGHDGVGIVSIEKTGTSGLVDTYTITFTSGNPVTYTVTNGRDADPTEIIDDNAGSGDTDKVWSADKSSSLLTEINSKADKTVTDALQKNKAPVIIDSAEGNPIVLTDGADGLPVESMKIHFLPKQDTSGGDPSPSNVCPISGWTGLTAWRTGMNMFEPTDSNYMVQDGVSFNGYDIVSLVQFLNTLGVGTYTISFKFNVLETISGATPWGILLQNTQSGYMDGRINGQHNSGETLTFTKAVTITESNVGKFAHAYLYSGGGNKAKVYWYDFQLELGSAATPYAEYAGDSYPVTFPDGQTVYGGTLDATTGVLTVDRALVDLGTLSPWYKISTSSPHWRFWTYLNTAKVNGTLLSSDYVQINPSVQYRGAEGVATQPSGVNVLVMVSDERYEEVNTFATAMSGVQLVYELATPIEIPLDPITVQTLIGDNTIWSDANGTIELDYRADTKLFIAKQKTDIRATIAPIEDGATASKAYSAGKFFYRGGNFCKAKTSIASGATFTLNTNYQITTVADELFALN